jgi:hypothetical protein
MSATVSKQARQVAILKGWPTLAIELNGNTANPKMDTFSMSGAISPEEYNDMMQAVTRILKRINDSK